MIVFIGVLLGLIVGARMERLIWKDNANRVARIWAGKFYKVITDEQYDEYLKLKYPEITP